MASADLKEELSCSICLSVYMEPVMLGCGHNFCRVCIARVLEIQAATGAYSCPECREEFPQRPALQRNIALCNIAQRFLSTWTEPEEMGTFCTYCVDSPVPALKSCVLCDASLCDKHLRVHSKSPEHVLAEPGTPLESRKCSVHKKILEYYCTADGVCVCVSCSLAGEHRGHQVEIVDEACEKKKGALRNAVQQAIKERSEAEARVLSLKEHRRKVQDTARTISERATTLLRRKLEELEKSVLGEIMKQQARISLSLSGQIQQLEIMKDELSKKIRLMEELCNVSDPLAVLQGSGPVPLPKASSKALSGPFSDLTLDRAQNLDVNKIHSSLHSGLDNAVSEIKRVFPVTPVFPCVRLTPPSIAEKKAGDVMAARPSLFGYNPPPAIKPPQCPGFLFN